MAGVREECLRDANDLPCRPIAIRTHRNMQEDVLKLSVPEPAAADTRYSCVAEGHDGSVVSPAGLLPFELPPGASFCLTPYFAFCVTAFKIALFRF